MKFLVLVFLIVQFANASAVTIKDAPMEWLIVQAMQQKIASGQYFNTEDTLMKEIFDVADYDKENDELIVHQGRKSNLLRGKLINLINSSIDKSKEPDPVFQMWRQEKNPELPIQVNVVKEVPGGFYFFNHVHTIISMDNTWLLPLKMGPSRTFRWIEKFLRKRDARGVVSFTDHNDDRAYDKAKHKRNGTLDLLRGVEWGGSTHMGLIGIKKDWEFVRRGREFKKEESIKVSKSSGGFRILNHPFRGDRTYPHAGWLDVDGIEVWNTILENAPYAKFNVFKKLNNRRALTEWTSALKAGKRYTAVGGTDFHFIIPCLRDRVLHYPANYIQGENISDAKELLLKGQSSFLIGPKVPKLLMAASFEGKQDRSIMGGEMQGIGNLQVELVADFTDTKKKMRSLCYNTIGAFSRLLSGSEKKKIWEMRFYNQAGNLIAKQKIDRRKFSPKKSFKANFTLAITGQELIRAELWSINTEKKTVDLLAATNPIYINR